MNRMAKKIGLGLAMGLPTGLLAQNTGTADSGLSNSLVFWLAVVAGIVVVFAIILVGQAIVTVVKLRERKARNMMTLAALLVFTLMASNASAQEVQNQGGALLVTDTTLQIFMVALIFLVFTLLIMVNLFRTLSKDLLPERQKESRVRVSWYKRFMQRMTDSVPVEREEEVMTDHNYDGIIELDNNLPPWWVAMFYICIFFGVVYMIHYHVLGTGPDSHEEYVAEMQKAEEDVKAYLAMKASNVDENSVTMVLDAGRLRDGKGLYMTHCKTCHGDAGQGLVGPNFTDNYWIHGGSIRDIFKTIKYGVPEKGMISWRNQLTPVQMQNVASYIKTLVGTNPPNPKEPQGELYVEESKSDSATTETPLPDEEATI